jgi:hypothetical protein
VRHSFTIVKQVPASRANVIANYLDFEHLPVHPGLASCRIISETERAACFEMTSRVGPFRIRNVHYFEFRPPHRILHAIRSPVGPMYIESTVDEIDGGDSGPRCEVTVQTTLELPSLLYPLRGLIERILRRLNYTVLQEDLAILVRRQALRGGAVDDYLRDQQRILFKETFRRHYGGS